MRICLVIRNLAPFFGNGSGSHELERARALAAAGHEVHVLGAATLHAPHLAEEAAGITVHRAAMAELPIRTFGGRSVAWPFAARQRLLELHDAHPFDYVELSSAGGEALFILRGKRYLGELAQAVVGLRLETPAHLRRELAGRADLSASDAAIDFQERAALAMADLWLAPSQALLDRLRPWVGDSVPASVVPPPFSAAHARPESRPRYVPTATARREVLYLGELGHRRGADLVVEAGLELLGRGHDLQFRFIGADTRAGPALRSTREQLVRAIPAAHRDRFVFQPPQPGGQRWRAIDRAAICCFPSRWESFRLATLEAMSVGAAVVCSDVGFFPELIEEGVNGLLFRSGDAYALAETLERALGNERLRAMLSDAAPARVEALCAPERSAAATIEAVEPLLGKSAAKGPARRRTRRKAPEVSVLLAPHLGERVGRTLDSVESQTLDEIEIIVAPPAADARYEEASFEPFESMRELERDRVQVLPAERADRARRWNATLAAAQGKWVLPLEGDELLLPGFLARTSQALRAEPELAFATSLVTLLEEKTEQPSEVHAPLGLDRDLLCVANVASIGPALMERTVLEDLGGFDEWLTAFESWDVFCKMAERGMEGAVLPESLVRRRPRPTDTDSPEVLRLRARLLARHPELAERPDRALRLQLSMGAEIETPFRHRIADLVHESVVRVAEQEPLRGILKTALRLARR